MPTLEPLTPELLQALVGKIASKPQTSNKNIEADTQIVTIIYIAKAALEWQNDGDHGKLYDLIKILNETEEKTI